MNKFVYFMAVGLAFTVLQVATVEAQSTAPATDCAATPGGPDAVAACWAAQTAGGGDTDADLPADDARCIVAPEARDHRCPGFVAP